MVLSKDALLGRGGDVCFVSLPARGVSELSLGDRERELLSESDMFSFISSTESSSAAVLWQLNQLRPIRPL